MNAQTVTVMVPEKSRMDNSLSLARTFAIPGVLAGGVGAMAYNKTSHPAARFAMGFVPLVALGAGLGALVVGPSEAREVTMPRDEYDEKVLRDKQESRAGKILGASTVAGTIGGATLLQKTTVGAGRTLLTRAGMGVGLGFMAGGALAGGVNVIL